MKFRGYTPQPYQRVVHDAITKSFVKTEGRQKRHTFTVLSPRQVGKSLLVENELLRFAINFSGCVSICLSPTLAQSRKVFKDIVKACKKAKIIKSANSTLLIIEFINGSEILFKSAEMKEALRGYTVTGILCIDEAAYVSDEIFSIIKPATNAHRSPILLTSTPRTKSGFFYEQYLLGQTDNNDNFHSFNFSDYDLSKFLTPEIIAEYQVTMPRQQFQTEIAGQWLDTQGMLFDNINNALVKDISVHDKSGKLFAGIDWATGVGKDSTVITIFNEKYEMVDYLRFNDKDTTRTVDVVCNKLKEYKNLHIFAECNGVGKPYCDLIKQRLPKYDITEFVTTNKTKTDQVSQLQLLLEQNSIKLLDDNELKLELAAYEATYNRNTGNISYNAPAGLNDDIVMSIMLALQCVKNKRISNIRIAFS